MNIIIVTKEWLGMLLRREVCILDGVLVWCGYYILGFGIFNFVFLERVDFGIIFRVDYF